MFRCAFCSDRNLTGKVQFDAQGNRRHEVISLLDPYSGATKQSEEWHTYNKANQIVKNGCALVGGAIQPTKDQGRVFEYTDSLRSQELSGAPDAPKRREIRWRAGEEDRGRASLSFRVPRGSR